MANELKPCPFCGGKAFIRHQGCTIESYYAYCGNEDCLMHPTTRTFFNKQDAIEAWNRRVDNVVIAVKCELKEMEGERA